MGKLTGPQAALLRDMADIGAAKSGNFWRDLGNPTPSLAALARKGLALCVDFRGDVRRSAYIITDAGRAALEANNG